MNIFRQSLTSAQDYILANIFRQNLTSTQGYSLVKVYRQKCKIWQALWTFWRKIWQVHKTIALWTFSGKSAKFYKYTRPCDNFRQNCTSTQDYNSLVNIYRQKRKIWQALWTFYLTSTQYFSGKIWQVHKNIALWTFWRKIWQVHKTIYSLMNIFRQNLTSTQDYSIVNIFRQNLTSTQDFSVVNIVAQNLTSTQYFSGKIWQVHKTIAL